MQREAMANILTSQMIPEKGVASESCGVAGSASSASELLQLRSCVLAIDMDCFYAQCEELRNPLLRGKPVGVQQKALVITSNYAARAFGIQKGDSLQAVREKCPDITICNGEDLTFYGQISQQVFDVAQRFTSRVEKLGLDEIFVDITELLEERLDAEPCGEIYGEGDAQPPAEPAEADCWRRLSVGSAICQEIREAIQQEVGLTSSAGISVSKLLAKMVSSWKKPNLQTIFLPTAQRLSLLLPDSLPVQKIPGIGFASTQRCQALNLHSIGQLVAAADAAGKDEKHELLKSFDVAAVRHMRLLCLGLDRSLVKASGPPKSCSAEDSFWQRPLESREAVKTSLEQLARKLLLKVRSVEQSFGYRGVPSMSLSVRHGGRELQRSKRERRQVQLGHLTVGNPKAKSSEPDAAKDQLLAKQLAEKAYGIFEKLVPVEDAFCLNILNLQLSFSEVAKGQQSLVFKAPVAAVDVDVEPPEPTELSRLLAMGFEASRAKRALQTEGCVERAVERLLRPRVELVELD